MVDALVRRIESAGMSVVGECSTLAECLALYATHNPDLVLCDVGLGAEGTGIELTAKLLNHHPDARVVMYSGYTDGDLVQEAMEAGARGYVSKTSSIPSLMASLEAVVAGEREVFDRVTGREMIGHLRRQAKPEAMRDPYSLTPRENEILQIMVEEQLSSTKDLAKRLTLSPQTVKSHLDNLMAKFGVGKRLELVRRALDEGIIGQGEERKQLPRRP